MQDRYVWVNGARIRYRAAGTSGPALVLLHGLGASLESWWYNLPALGAEFRVFAPDLIYFGKSDKPPRTPDADEFVRFVLEFMDALQLTRATLVGNSMGGTIAAKVAIMRPERVQALVLANPAGFGPEIAWWLRLRSVLYWPFYAHVPKWLTRYSLRLALYDPNRVSDEWIDAMRDIAREPGLSEAYRRVIRLGIDWRGIKPLVLREIRDAAHQISAPTLILWGRQDPVLPFKQALVAAQRIPKAKLYIFERCGHAPMIEHPDEFNARVAEFVREHVRDAAA